MQALGYVAGLFVIAFALLMIFDVTYNPSEPVKEKWEPTTHMGQ